MSPEPFEVGREELDRGIEVFTVRGELDLSTAPQLEKQLAGCGSAVVLDLTGCEFIDSTGIALIVRTWQRLDRDGGGRLVLCSHNHQVRRLLKITGVEGSIPMHDRREQALAELAA